MVSAAARTPFSVLDENAVSRWLVCRGLSCSASVSLGRAFVQAEKNGVHVEKLQQMWEFADNTVGRHCRQALEDAAQTQVLPLTSRIQQRHECSSDERLRPTTKMLLEFRDGSRVEAVIIRQKHWATLCVSSQVGCKMGCTFCATGTMRTAVSLSAGQILEQLVHALRIEPATSNIVFMGMGEPFNNYEAVMQAIQVMVDPRRFGLAPRKICISTVGVVPKMLTMARDAPGVCMALSLHAPTQKLRQRIIPTASAYPLERIMEALDMHLRVSRKTRVLVECIVIKVGERCIALELQHHS